MSGDGKICVTVGKVAGSIARHTTKTSNKISEKSQGISKGLKKTYKSIGGKSMTLCKKIGNLYKTAKDRGGIARWEERQKDVFSRLGAEVWNLYQGKVFKSVFEQNSIKKLVKELEEYENEVQKKKDELAAQKKIMDELAVFKQAKANLESKNPRVRKVAIKVLDKLGSRDAIPHLNKMLGDQEEDVREKAAKVLHRLVDVSLKLSPITSKKVEEIKKMMEDVEDNEPVDIELDESAVVEEVKAEAEEEVEEKVEQEQESEPKPTFVKKKKGPGKAK